MSEKHNEITQERKRKLAALFKALSIVADDSYVYICDMHYDYSIWSRSLVATFGLPSEYMYNAGKIWEEHVHPDDREVYKKGIDEIFQGKSEGHDMQYRAQKPNGEYDVCTCRGIVFFDEKGEPEYFGGAIRNHNEQSHLDRLTGLKNQYGFFEDVKHYILKEAPVTVILIGISLLKEINEIYGYQTGNRLLQKFGRYLLNKNGGNGNVYRLDGSKFAIVSETTNANRVNDFYNELRVHFRNGVYVDEYFVTLELTAGMLKLDDFNTDAQTVYACLNLAYDESKYKKHGDIVEFYNAFNASSIKRIEILHLIRNSIILDNQGFFLAYQPIVDANTEKLIGAEVLLRWRAPNSEVIPPDMFISILEKDPLFIELGEWIMEQAMTNAKKILEYIPDFVININLSYTQLEKKNFVDSVYGILKNTGYPAENLCLELTERCRMLDDDLLLNIMESFKSNNVHIALDDFGTGYASIGLLKLLRFNTLKVDKSFIQKIETDDRDKKTLNLFSQVATAFGSNICVEGVETAGMRDALREYNIHSFQGYFYSKPITFEELLKAAQTDPGYFSKSDI
ncbi:MAG: EAL domain-containing protein [Lachnospiraceae bacterium]|nr:EAL domain-containing protein [Lachnospiraceae bacterium]